MKRTFERWLEREPRPRRRRRTRDLVDVFADAGARDAYLMDAQREALDRMDTLVEDCASNGYLGDGSWR